MTAETVTPNGTSTTTFQIDVQGSGFVPGATIQISGTPVATTYISATDVQATYTATASGTVALNVVKIQIPGPRRPARRTSKSRSTRRPSRPQPVYSTRRPLALRSPISSMFRRLASTATSRSRSGQPQPLLPDITNPPPTICATNLIPCEQSEWWQTVLTGPDQLRQRVAFALSEIMVISTNSNNADSVIPYQNLLAKGCVRKLLDNHEGCRSLHRDGSVPEHAE